MSLQLTNSDRRSYRKTCISSKEMVENSIDAGATNIVVEIKNGGISFIRCK